MRRLHGIAAALLLVGGGAACHDGLTDPAAPPAGPTTATTTAAVVGPSLELEPAMPVGLELLAEGLTHPLTLTQVPDGTGRLFIIDQVGLIRVLLPDGTLQGAPFLDVRSQIVELTPDYDERGLLGIAFHPGFATNGRFFIYYSAPPRLEGYDNTSVVAEYTVTPGDVDATPTFVREVIAEDQPQFNHEGGTLAFGPDDGFLYISWGDGGGANDIGEATAEEWLAGDQQGHVPDWYETNAGGNGQDRQANLLGNILRIDVDNGTPYGIPADNPFVGDDCANGCDEIYAYGFRNPYRFSFDMGGSHQLFVGDAGQDMWEEVSIVTRGGNYGWNVKEGTHCFNATVPNTVRPSCPGVDPTTGTPLTDPIIEHPNLANPNFAEGWLTVVGGFVYRGTALPALHGKYVFASFSSDETAADGELYLAEPRPSGLWPIRELEVEDPPGGSFEQYILGFGQDEQGEMYVLTTSELGPTGTTGRVYRLAAPGAEEGRVALEITPTAISLSRSSTVSVYAYSTASFDATTIDVASARLAAGDGTGVPVARRGDDVFTTVRDYNGDGLDDRLLVFLVSDLTGAGLTTTNGTLTLRGTAGGQEFTGQDPTPPEVVP